MIQTGEAAEVAWRIILPLTSHLESRGISGETLFRSIGREDLLRAEVSDWISLDTYCAITEGAAEHMTDETWRQLGTSFFDTTAMKAFATIVGWTLPSIDDAFEWLCRSAGGPDSHLFRTLTFNYIRRGKGRARIVVHCPRPMPYGFAMPAGCVMASVPRLLGGREASVTRSQNNNDWVYDLTYAERPLWVAARSLFVRFAPGAAEAAELRAVYDAAMEESASARRSVAKERALRDDTPVPDETLAGPGVCVNDRYLLLRLIGRGTMGRVFLAKDSRLGLDVAVKMLAVNESVHEGAREDHERRFLREAKTLAQLDNPYIVRLLDYGVHQRIPYLVLEYVEGTSLHQLLRKGALPVEVAERVFRQLCQALEHAHGRGVVHRDLSPGNLLLRDVDATLKVLDFGLAKFTADLDDLSSPDHVVGTPWFISPEAIRGQAVDARSDIYSAGVLFYRMLAGRFPYQAVGEQVYQAHLDEQPMPFAAVAPGRRIPARLEHVALTCLEKSAERRFQTAKLALEALDKPSGWWPFG